MKKERNKKQRQDDLMTGGVVPNWSLIGNPGADTDAKRAVKKEEAEGKMDTPYS